MEISRYHKVLRVSLLVVFTVFIFDGGYLSPLTKNLSDSTIEYLASAASGVFASVPPNELNQLTAELTARERELQARENALSAREIAARDFGTSKPDYSTYILSVILLILTVLIVLNYVFDWLRIKNQFSESKTI